MEPEFRRTVRFASPGVPHPRPRLTAPGSSYPPVHPHMAVPTTGREPDSMRSATTARSRHWRCGTRGRLARGHRSGLRAHRPAVTPHIRDDHADCGLFGGGEATLTATQDGTVGHRHRHLASPPRSPLDADSIASTLTLMNAAAAPPPSPAPRTRPSRRRPGHRRPAQRHRGLRRQPGVVRRLAPDGRLRHHRHLHGRPGRSAPGPFVFD